MTTSRLGGEEGGTKEFVNNPWMTPRELGSTTSMSLFGKTTERLSTSSLRRMKSHYSTYDSWWGRVGERTRGSRRTCLRGWVPPTGKRVRGVGSSYREKRTGYNRRLDGQKEEHVLGTRTSVWGSTERSTQVSMEQGTLERGDSVGGTESTTVVGPVTVTGGPRCRVGTGRSDLNVVITGTGGAVRSWVRTPKGTTVRNPESEIVTRDWC